ncbi:hypothetical protein XH99_00320 [Bradyrhizobium nanningense]|uniref:Uncharacterized protein n=1 Tax=Bradyrhizobium nanningense TaxID=1325118 RepID=A0A4Q0SHH1_9BRAD|nr:hypothetical protein [Bradyrhizobium nanningense]RXH38737.1 hypothetical protein XH99_00320 [Bradyrhizobium nanningense]
MDPFEAGQILRGDGISAKEQEGQENETGAQWNRVLTTGYDAADSAYAEDDQDQTVENWAAERDVGLFEDREEALTRLTLSERDKHLDLGSRSVCKSAAAAGADKPTYRLNFESTALYHRFGPQRAESIRTARQPW